MDILIHFKKTLLSKEIESKIIGNNDILTWMEFHFWKKKFMCVLYDTGVVKQ